MPMTHIPLSCLDTEADSVSSKTSTLQDIANPSVMSNTQSDILQIIRKEEDHAMSLLAASPLLSSLFLTYANRAATLDGPPTPSPLDTEWTEMKTLNTRLQEEVASLRAQLNKETDRAKMSEDCVEALRAQLSSVKDANRDLEVAVSDERARLDAITSDYAGYKKEAGDTIAELRATVDKEANARSALSQVIADQQVTLAQLKERNWSRCGSPVSIEGKPSLYPEEKPSPYPKGKPSPYPEGNKSSPYPEGNKPSPYPEGKKPSPYPEGKKPSPYSEEKKPSPYAAGIPIPTVRKDGKQSVPTGGWGPAWGIDTPNKATS